jgi:hypothetical protein
MGAPTPDRDRQRIQHLEKEVQQLNLRIDPRRNGIANTPRFSRLAITVPWITPPEGQADYPLPPADVFPIQFLDVVDNDAAETDLDLDKSTRADSDDNPMTVAMHVRGEYVARGSVVEVLNQRPINGDKTVEEGLVSDAIEWWITGVHDAVAVKNTSGEEIPAHAIMLPGKVPADEHFTPVSKPDTTTVPLYLVNSRYPIPVDGIGIAYHWKGRSGTCLKSPGQTAEVGDEFGPLSGSWELDADGTGFVITHQLPDAGLCFALQTNTGGGSGERDYGRVKVLNVEPGNLSAGQTVRIGKLLLDPSGEWEQLVDEPYFEARAASKLTSAETYRVDPFTDRMFGNDQERFGILTEDIAVGETGYAVVSGVCAAFVYVRDRLHTRVRVSADDGYYHLESAHVGEGVLLWSPPDASSGTVFTRCVVSLSGAPAPIKNAFLTVAPFDRPIGTGTITKGSPPTETTEFYLDYPDFRSDGQKDVLAVPGLASHGITGDILTPTTQYDNFSPCDFNGGVGGSAGAFLVLVSGVYLLSVNLESEAIEFGGAPTDPSADELDAQEIETRYILSFYRRRNGQFQKMTAVRQNRSRFFAINFLTRDGSGHVTDYNWHHMEGHPSEILGGSKINEQARTHLVTLNKGDVVFFGVSGSVEPSGFFAYSPYYPATTSLTTGASMYAQTRLYVNYSLVLVNATNHLATYPAGEFVATDWDISDQKEVDIGSGDGKDKYVTEVATLQQYQLFQSITTIYAGISAVRTLNKFNSFSEAESEKVHNLGSDSLKWLLTNSAPVATNTQKSNFTEIAAGNGYSAGGIAATISSSSQSSGRYKLTLGDSVLTASGGSVGPFSYAVLYNDTATNDEAIGWIDCRYEGSAITLSDGGTYTIDCNATVGTITKG